MGLFSKKTYICEKCGKMFEKRINRDGNICDECKKKEANERNDLLNSTSGYRDYATKLLQKEYSDEELRAISKHRDDLLEKLKFDEGISREELSYASYNYKSLTDEQAANILLRVAASSISCTMGAAYTNSFFVPTAYDKMIVDVEDVFAVGFTSSKKIKNKENEAILCVCFTNDPYIPVFPMMYFGKKGFFEISKSKKGREGVISLFERLCPKMTYPVQDIKQLRKQLETEEKVKGNIELKQMQYFIAYALSEINIFNPYDMGDSLLPGSVAMIESIGYIQTETVSRILQMDKMFNRKYWNKKMEKLTQQ